MRAVLFIVAFAAVALCTATNAGSDVEMTGADVVAHLLRTYPNARVVRDLPARWRVAFAKASVATNPALNALAFAYANEEAAAAEPELSRFASSELSAEDELLDTAFDSLEETTRLNGDGARYRFRAFKAELMALAELEVQEPGMLSIFGKDQKSTSKPIMNTGVGSLFGKAFDKVKGGAESIPLVGDAVKKVQGVDIHALSGKVAKVAGVVNTVSGALAPVLAAGTLVTAPIPVVGEVMAGATVANTAIGVGSGIVKTGAELVHDNTKEGETLGQAIGRAKDYAVKVGNDPTVLARDGAAIIKRKIAECTKDPTICAKLGLKVGSMAASIAGQGGLSKGLAMGGKAMDIAGKIQKAEAKAAKGAKAAGKGAKAAKAAKAAKGGKGKKKSGAPAKGGKGKGGKKALKSGKKGGKKGGLKGGKKRAGGGKRALKGGKKRGAKGAQARKPKGRKPKGRAGKGGKGKRGKRAGKRSGKRAGKRSRAARAARRAAKAGGAAQQEQAESQVKADMA